MKDAYFFCQGTLGVCKAFGFWGQNMCKVEVVNDEQGIVAFGCGVGECGAWR